ncbi:MULTISPECIES: hypothetical protein [unclassified Roseitalea]|uniref:hypothetical protein n=1 Tax=unclassified Roseitalea TaxID=2639107 RepID=UPI00273DA876|nr:MULTISPECIES: hypothetical protein [unclassified Roseitalea]
MSPTHTLVGPHGRLTLRAAGGMIGPATFDVPGAGAVSPLTCPDWAERPGAEDWLPVIRNLCGDFVCVPYGAPGAPNDALPARWRQSPGPGIAGDRWFHGYAVNHDWEVVPGAEATTASMTCRPPEPHPLAEVTRRVALLPDQPGYEAELSLQARADVDFPLSLHPCFVMPGLAGSMHVDIPDAGRGWTYPLPVVHDHAPVVVDGRFDRLAAVPRGDGGSIDFTHLPPDERCEALLQLPAPAGKLQLGYPEAGYSLQFTYDAALLPTLVLWVSNRGRNEAPFDGEFRTLGVEAVAGAFDLGPAVSQSTVNPIAIDGLSTTVALKAGERLTTTATVALEAFAAEGS